jgi:hypothetical protein
MNYLRNFLGALACTLLVSAIPSGATAGAENGDNSRDGKFEHHNKQKFEFALIGDTGYSAQEADFVTGLIQELSDEKLELVVHVGDFKGQGTAQPCTDASYLAIHDQFDQSAHPFIYTPGDNEWVDCQFAGPAGVLPVERLEALRRIFFPGIGTDPLFSLGQRRMLLESQSADPAHSKFRENTRWTVGEIMFVTVNVPDSDNQGVTRCLEFSPFNICVRTGIDNSEWLERTPANVAWLNRAYDLAIAQDMKGLVVILQANVIGGFLPTRYDPRSPRFQAIVDTLTSRSTQFGGQVLLAHGDTHTFRVDQPFNGNLYPNVIPGTQQFILPSQVVENLTRVEVYGSTAARRLGSSPQEWVRVTVDSDSANVFKIQRGIN